MAASKINFHYEDIPFKVPASRETKSWLKQVAQEEDYSISEINYIFCSDSYLLEINKQYLDHHDLTDIITFDNSDTEGIIESDIFISVDRVKENAALFKESFEREIKRVMVHGLLHLCGYKDKTSDQKTKMRAREDHYLHLLNS